MAKNGGLHERRIRHGTSSQIGLFIVRCARDLHGNELGRTFTITRHLTSEHLRERIERGLEFFVGKRAFRNARTWRCLATCQQEAGIVR